MTLGAEPTPPNADPGDALPCDAIVESGPPQESVTAVATAIPTTADPGQAPPDRVRNA